MLKDKFLVLFSVTGYFKILNLKKILDAKQQEDSADPWQHLLADFHVDQIAHSDDINKVSGYPQEPLLQVVDDLQIGLTTQLRGQGWNAPLPYSLYTFDFVGAWQFPTPS